LLSTKEAVFLNQLLFYGLLTLESGLSMIILDSAFDFKLF